MTGFEFLLVGSASVIAGAVNALAGGGTLITFPILTAVGIPAVAANITNTVALCPGYLGGTLAQLKDLKGNEKHLRFLIPAGIFGGILGGVLLLHTGERTFSNLVPWLILLASGLLALQGPVRRWLSGRSGRGPMQHSDAWMLLSTSLAAVYGGYFGAGLSVILLAVLGLVLEETLTRLNALKQAFALTVNVAAAVFFLFSGKVLWPAAIVMAVGALLGGTLGGRLASCVRPSLLRWIVVALGGAVSIIYFLR